jgi:hypothetical protein
MATLKEKFFKNRGLAVNPLLEGEMEADAEYLGSSPNKPPVMPGSPKLGAPAKRNRTYTKSGRHKSKYKITSEYTGMFAGEDAVPPKVGTNIVIYMDPSQDANDLYNLLNQYGLTIDIIDDIEDKNGEKIAEIYQVSNF